MILRIKSTTTGEYYCQTFRLCPMRLKSKFHGRLLQLSIENALNISETRSVQKICVDCKPALYLIGDDKGIQNVWRIASRWAHTTTRKNWSREKWYLTMMAKKAEVVCVSDSNKKTLKCVDRRRMSAILKIRAWKSETEVLHREKQNP